MDRGDPLGKYIDIFFVVVEDLRNDRRCHVADIFYVAVIIQGETASFSIFV